MRILSFTGKVQAALRMPWWHYGCETPIPGPIAEHALPIAASTFLEKTDPAIEARFPSRPKVEYKDGLKQLSVDCPGHGGYVLQFATLEPVGHMADPEVAKKLLDIGEKYILDSLRQRSAKLSFSSDFLLSNIFPARTFEVALPDERICRWVLVLGPEHSFSLAVEGDKRFVSSGKAHLFLRSFEITR
jgi:hypothetical protein